MPFSLFDKTAERVGRTRWDKGPWIQGVDDFPISRSPHLLEKEVVIAAYGHHYSRETANLIPYFSSIRKVPSSAEPSFSPPNPTSRPDGSFQFLISHKMLKKGVNEPG